MSKAVGIPINLGVVDYKSAYHWYVHGVTLSKKLLSLLITNGYISQKESPRVLDIGCGDGFMTDQLVEKGRSITGVDVSLSGLRFAKVLSSSNINYLQADALRLPFGGGTFDVITAFDTIEHIEKDTSFVYEVRRVLKQDGLVVITTLNRQRLFNRRSNKHWREYSARELKRLMSQSFNCIEVCGLFFYVPLLGLWPLTRAILMTLGINSPTMSRDLLYVGRVKREEWL